MGLNSSFWLLYVDTTTYQAFYSISLARSLTTTTSNKALLAAAQSSVTLGSLNNQAYLTNTSVVLSA